jgi:phage anti-repressor protein
MNENEEQIVSGRELHEFLEVDTPYKQWFDRMCDFGFVENVDYSSFAQKCVKLQVGRPGIDHALSIDMAKQICMLARSEKGKEARQYFIQLEKDWNSPDKVIARGLKFANIELSRVRAINERLQIELDASKDWYSIKRVALINGISWKRLDWRKLKEASIIMDIPIHKIFDANYGEVNTYHIDVFRKVYPRLRFS